MPKTFVFALTPLDNAFDDAYELGIKGACDEVGAYCERVDPAMYEGVIGDRIHILISKADIVVAEMSSQSPEVFYQTGYSHALGKPVILVTRDGGDIPFNLNQYAHIVYEDIAPLKSELVERLRWVMDNPGSDPAHAEFPLEFYLAGEALASVELPKVPMKSMTTSSGDGLKLKLDYHNGSERPFAGTFNIGIATEQFERNDSGAKVISLPDGKFLHLFQPRVTLLPDCWDNLEWVLRTPVGTAYPWGSEFPLEITVSSEYPRKEYQLTVEGVRF